MALYVNSNLALELPADSEHQVRAPEAASDPRAELATQFIPSGARVFDLGATAAMRALLPNGCTYVSAGRAGKKRGARSGDLNSGEFPTEAASQSDVIVMLGVLERVADVESLFTHLRFCKRDIILSYCPTDLAKDCDRAALGFVNHLSLCDLALLFDRYGFRIESTAPIDATQMLMRVTPAERLAPVTSCNVAVISGDRSNDLGARLGRQMINAVLPGECAVHHLTVGTQAARHDYDLVILGAGSGLFPPLLGEGVLDVIARAKAAIGIFGTEGRELIARPVFSRILVCLDTWFARYEDDVLIYGRGRNNVVHAGDWLIDQFPLARATNDEPLVISGDLGPELALDRAISTIQQHKQVYSTVPAALLCALTSADLAAYADMPAQQPDLATGQFRSMLIDIFGRTYPQQKFFLVHRDATGRAFTTTWRRSAHASGPSCERSRLRHREEFGPRL